jgi:hypothetical protein
LQIAIDIIKMFKSCHRTCKLLDPSLTQPNGPGTRPEYYMHRLRSFAMINTADSFRQGATAFKNPMDLTSERRNAAIARTNEIAAQTIDEEEEDIEEGEDDNDDEAEAKSSNTMHSFDCGTNQNSTLAEDEDEDQDEKRNVN